MTRLFRRVRRKAGLAPGTVEFTGERRMDKARLRIIDFNREHLEEVEVDAVDELFGYRDSDSVTWINVDGVHDEEVITTLGGHFGMHKLVLEDIVNTHQRPKSEDSSEHIFVVLRMLYVKADEPEVHSEQISLVFGPGWVLSFQERVGDIFEGVRERLRQGRGRIRGAGSDYLTYALIDAIVDHYFKILERFGEEIEEVEAELLDEPSQEHLNRIHTLKRELILVRRAIWPLREVASTLVRSESPLIHDETRVFLRDVYDHTVQVADAVESFRDVLGGLQDLYLSSLSHKTNETMKVLTLIATIFIPLGFMAGIFGMNFDVMPELHWKWSYLFFWLAVLTVAGGMLFFFRRRRWL